MIIQNLIIFLLFYTNNSRRLWCNNTGLVALNHVKFAINKRVIHTTTSSKNSHGWHNIDWKLVNNIIIEFQEKIVIATEADNMKEVYKLQWKLINTFEAKAWAVRKIITNKRGKTPGTDNVTWSCPSEYYEAIMQLGEIIKNVNSYKSSPLLRVHIPKNNQGETRPLGIPTMIDRALQALYHLSVDPVVETRSDPNSYGFRKNRSTHDTITAIRSILDKKTHPRWILEADISKCFDKIDHSFLMKHTPICHKNVLREWLKAGIMENMNYSDTSEGTPQGGVISPTLANIALNGLEGIVKKANPLKKGISAGVHVIRYADDMIITGRTEEVLKKNKEILENFLKERGLQLNQEKTLMTNINEGFDFIGFNLRRRPWKAKFNKVADQDTVLVIKPSKKGIDKLKQSIREVIGMNKPLIKIISELNPILRGWGEHKRISYHSQETFISIDHWLYEKLMKWAKRKKGSLRRILKKYVIPTSNRSWNWMVNNTKLVNLGEIAIVIKRPLKLDKNPYLTEHQEYFEKRREQLIEAKFRAAIYKDYKHKCPVCEMSLHNGEPVELHHIIPRIEGGKYTRENILPLHQICHHQVTRGNHTLQRLKVALPKQTKSSRRIGRKSN